LFPGHQVCSGSEICLTRSCDKAQLESIAGGCSAVGGGIGGSVEGTVSRVGHSIGADGGILCVAGMVISGALGGVEPSLIGVNDDRLSRGSTFNRSANT
jgi:hypothetical protein